MQKVSMKWKILLAVSLVGVFLASVVIHMPASFVVGQASLPRALTLSGVQGTVWQGRVSQVSWQGQQLGEVNWRFQPSKLLTGKAEVSLRFGRGSDLALTGRGHVGYGLSGAYAENVVASLPINNVMEYVTLPAPITLEGRVEVALSEFRYQAPIVHWPLAV